MADTNSYNGAHSVVSVNDVAHAAVAKSLLLLMSDPPPSEGEGGGKAAAVPAEAGASAVDPSFKSQQRLQAWTDNALNRVGETER